MLVPIILTALASWAQASGHRLRSGLRPPSLARAPTVSGSEPAGEFSDPGPPYLPSCTDCQGSCALPLLLPAPLRHPSIAVSSVAPLPAEKGVQGCSPSPHRQQNAKARSVWEQRTSQLRLQNLRASCEALYSELGPEERLRFATARHLRPDMKTHLDRPLVVEPGREGTRGPAAGKVRPEGVEVAEGGEAAESADPPRRHHRHREKDKAPGQAGEQDRADAPKAESGEPAAPEERARPHRSRSKETAGTREARSERGRGAGPEGGRRHHRRGSPEEAAEREPRCHRGHRHADQGKDGATHGARGERRARHRGPRVGLREGESSEEPARRHRARHRQPPAHEEAVEKEAEAEDKDKDKDKEPRDLPPQ